MSELSITGLKYVKKNYVRIDSCFLIYEWPEAEVFLVGKRRGFG
jgi:hypothetical protein